MTTSLESFNDLDAFAARSDEATAKGAHAFGRLLHLAETSDTGQVSRIARFLAAVYNGAAFPLDPFELRAVDVAISDDMLTCLNALRWGRVDLHTLVHDGDARMRATVRRWLPDRGDGTDDLQHHEAPARRWTAVGP